ncbi:helix-turn-helix domain-containing protein [Burkholderia sp. Tr-20390]|uniref:helix-turn-helix domain-containing protein n=1 Tax=Burkholderia sp. Tr-20390 TaxID=2703904 RepID=UPI001980CA63|nr:helix-turn-helix domain-containing protein [Burkholderia sp. Tr-20390]MBN3730904.1 helix-turn-helix domain-containing protein [Burkholderia sp. Tr-20390]
MDPQKALDGAQLPEILTTAEAAAALNLKAQTLRRWACLENGPIRPVRISNRLAWKVTDIRALLNGGR